jgi:hypothetical protein
VKTPGSLPSEDAALILLFSLVASGQVKLRRIDGWRKIATVLSRNTPGRGVTHPNRDALGEVSMRTAPASLLAALALTLTTSADGG